MLVISRRTQQQVVFPHLGIRVSILQVKGRLVKLGIEAPDSVKVFRDEVIGQIDDSVEAATEPADAEPGLQHRRRNELQLLQLRLLSVQRRIDRGEDVDAESTLQWLLGSAQSFDQEISSAQSSRSCCSTGRAPRLLIVEDCDNERRLMAYLLAQSGFDVHVARDGSEAIEQLRLWRARPDFVLMDMQMPLSSGLETLQWIRHDERLCDLKVIAVTGCSRHPDLEPAGRGWDAWFQKPLNVQKLVDYLQAEHTTQLAGESPEVNAAEAEESSVF